MHNSASFIINACNSQLLLSFKARSVDKCDVLMPMLRCNRYKCRVICLILVIVKYFPNAKTKLELKHVNEGRKSIFIGVFS